MQRSSVLSIIIILGLALAVPVGAGELPYTFTTIDVPIPGADTFASGINNAGEIVGDFPAIDLAAERGFLKSGSTFTFFDAPGATGPFGTQPKGINTAGQIVGFFSDRGQPFIHGFLKVGNQHHSH